MKLLLPAALLVAALPALAQGPGGPMDHGPGGFGGPMRTPVTNAPYSATFTSTSTEKLQDGTVITRTDTRSASRDSMGRIREELDFPAHGDKPAHTFITIVDPVARTVTQLQPDEKTAVVRALRTPPASPSGTVAPAPDAAHTPRDNNNVVRADLGSKTIDGDVASGTRTTRTIPAGTMGNAAAIVSTDEKWVSTDLKIELMRTDNDPFHGTHTTTVTSLNRTEPNAALFTVPSGYTVKQATDHAGGRHGFGPRGGDVPPPPSADGSSTGPGF